VKHFKNIYLQFIVSDPVANIIARRLGEKRKNKERNNL